MHESRTGCDTQANDANLKFSRPEFWRSADDLEKTPEFRELMAREFGPNAQELASGDERRTFIKLMGAGFALAGLAACRRWPDTKIVPFAQGQVLKLEALDRIKPSAAEVAGNPRSRSAIMRVARRTAQGTVH